MSRITEELDRVRPYWDAFWRGDIPMLCATVPHDPAHPVPKPSLGITQKTDIDALADSLLEWAAANEFLGGAFPFYCVYLFDVYNLTARLLGGEVEECGDSHGMIPFIDDLDTAELAIDLQSPSARRLQAVTERLRERCGDSVLISACAIGGNLDALEAARGSFQLLLDLNDNPAGVHRCLEQVDAAVGQVLDFQAELYDFETMGSVCRHGMYSRGRVGIPQCDFGYMIGPKHFAEFAMPYLRREFARLDGVCYHLDGIGNLPNLGILCEEPNLHLIQWVPGTGHEHEDWSWLSEQIDELGKGMMRGGSIATFEQWHSRHSAPWQYWNIYEKSPETISACLRNLVSRLV